MTATNNDLKISLPVTEINTASWSQGMNWVFKAFALIVTKSFWWVLLLVILGGVISSLIGYIPIPFLSGFTALIVSAIIFSWVTREYYLGVRSINAAVSAVFGKFIDLLILFFLKILFAALCYTASIIILFAVFGVDLYNNAVILYDYFADAMASEHATIYDFINMDLMKIKLVLANVFQSLSADPLILRSMLIHLFLWICLSMLSALLIFMTEFFAIPLVLFGKERPFQAMLLSFKAFNKNWISITGYGVALLFILALGVCLLSGLLLLSVSMWGTVAAMVLAGGLALVLAVTDYFIKFYATRDVFWSSYPSESDSNKMQ